jgi:prolipoprotein diacylglyceryltransferase
MGALMAAGILAVSDYLTGAILGLPSDLPWARPYYGEMQHPAALYRAVGFLISIVVIWLFANPQRPGRIVGYAALAAGLVVLVADAFAANSPVTGALRTSQLVGLGLALVAAAGLAVTARRLAPPIDPVPPVAS